jgi:hypothetical protein
MIIQIKINNRDGFLALAKSLGGEVETHEVIGKAVDAFLLGQMERNRKSQKQMIHDLVMSIGEGSPKDFFDAYHAKNPQSDISYTTLNVYIRNMVATGDLIKIGRGQYVCVAINNK